MHLNRLERGLRSQWPPGEDKRQHCHHSYETALHTQLARSWASRALALRTNPFRVQSSKFPIYSRKQIPLCKVRESTVQENFHPAPMHSDTISFGEKKNFVLMITSICFPTKSTNQD